MNLPVPISESGVDLINAVAGYEVTCRDLLEFGRRLGALFGGVLAACAERTAARSVEGAGDVAGEDDALGPALFPDVGNRREERLGIRMQRP